MGRPKGSKNKAKYHLTRVTVMAVNENAEQTYPDMVESELKDATRRLSKKNRALKIIENTVIKYATIGTDKTGDLISFTLTNDILEELVDQL